MTRTLTHKYLNVTFVLSICLLLLGSGSAQSAYGQMGGGGMPGGGMPGGGNQTNMGNGMGGLMMVSGGTPYHTDGTLVGMNDAINIATQYLNSQSTSGLALDEIEEWDYNFYVVVKEVAPSQFKAYQLVIDKLTGIVMPEPGPNMMWNWKYGGMMNGASMHPRKKGFGGLTVSPDQAVTYANQFLAQRFGPARSFIVDGQPDMYYGYYTCDVKDAVTGTTVGMLSVEGSSGQVWYHTWHGAFMHRQELNP